MAMPWSEAHAEAPAAEVQKDEEDGTTEKSTESEVEENDKAEEEEEEEDLVDPKEVLEEECQNSPACLPAKHHFEECVERVTSAEEGSTTEDCVEEFFHLVHCATNCAAPKLWSILK
ncbi:hypothetical protein K3495_g2937 [Podosphaera aphanis]|nr:hypothetical protein K3495_g2937 [Podosphaera aphanis]